MYHVDTFNNDSYLLTTQDVMPTGNSHFSSDN